MSSFDPLLPDAGGRTFAPLGPGAGACSAASPGGPFPDLHAPPCAVEPECDAAAAEEEAERARALEAEYERGARDGRAAAERELAELGRGLDEAIREVALFRAALRERCHAELLDLALEVARRMLDRELEAHPEHWIPLIRAGVQRALDRERVRIRVAPPLHGYLRERVAELHAELDGVKELEVVADPTLPATGCVVETPCGDLDLGVASQVETIRSALGEPA